MCQLESKEGSTGLMEEPQLDVQDHDSQADLKPVCPNTPQLPYPHFSLQTSSPNHITPEQIHKFSTQANNSSAKQKTTSFLFSLNMLVPQLCLSQCNWGLGGKNNPQTDCMTQQSDKATPLTIDASLNRVSVLGWVGECLPGVCPHQCKGWSQGVRYTGTGHLRQSTEL